jgi:hypothetical protein
LTDGSPYEAREEHDQPSHRNTSCDLVQVTGLNSPAFAFGMFSCVMVRIPATNSSWVNGRPRSDPASTARRSASAGS